MNSQPTCPICGGVEYFKDSGFYYCKECRTQSQDIREEIFDDWTGAEAFVNTPSQTKKRGKITKDDGKDWTTWEAYNWILKGMVDQIIELGAKPSLKAVMLQLWATYLQKLELAFMSKREPLLPKIGPSFSYKDARLIYGKKFKSGSKHKLKKDSIIYTTSNSSFSESEARKNYFKCKRALIKSEQKTADVTGSSLDFTSRMEQSLQLSDSLSMSSGTTLDESLFSRRTKYSKKVYEIKKRRTPNAKRVAPESVSSRRTSKHLNVFIISRSKLISFLQLGLLINEDEQQLSDIIRWIREGHLSYYHLSHFFPDSVKISGSDRILFDKIQRIPDYSVIHDNTNQLASFIGVIYLPHPNVEELTQRFVNELGLPNMLVDIVLNLSKILPILPFQGASRNFISYEMRVMAMLMFTLKLLIGLDDKTEHKISQTAQKLNCAMKHELELFEWDKWVTWTDRRNVLLSQYHFTSCVSTQDDKTNLQHLVDSWQHVIKDVEFKQKIKPSGRTKCFDTVVTEVLKKPFHLLTQLDEKYQQKLTFPATMTPKSTYINIISSFMSEDDKKFLQKGFKNCNLKFLLDPQKLVDLCKLNGIKLITLERNSHGKFKKIKQIIPTTHRYDNVKISIIPDEINEMNVKHLNALVPKHKTSRKRKVSSKSFDERYGDLTDTLKRNKRMKNAYYKQSEDFLYFHLNTVSNNFVKLLDDPNNSCRTVGREPTDKECLELGLPSLHHYSKQKRNDMEQTVHSHSRLKKLKLYLPFKQYWVSQIPDIHSKYSIPSSKFDKDFVNKLPVSFYWLLRVCAQLIEVDKNDLLKEFLHFEQSACECKIVE